jgi:hypothetical protein
VDFDYRAKILAKGRCHADHVPRYNNDVGDDSSIVQYVASRSMLLAHYEFVWRWGGQVVHGRGKQHHVVGGEVKLGAELRIVTGLAPLVLS